MKIIRVFPRKTKGTPDDDMVFIGDPPLFRPEADEVYISCTFTWDKSEAERLADGWSEFYDNVKLGGPAYNDPGGEFIPGMYLKQGYVITSRGCPHKCNQCLVPKNEGDLRLLQIKDGWNVVDNNLLACPGDHINAVFDMLKHQPKRAEFTGGIESRLLKDWHVKRLMDMKFKRLYIAYDHEGQREDVQRVADMFLCAGIKISSLRPYIGCYCLIGYDGDTIYAARERLEYIQSTGIRPYPMYYRDEETIRNKIPTEWNDLIRPYMIPMRINITKPDPRDSQDTLPFRECT